MSLDIYRVENSHELDAEKNCWNSLLAQNATKSAFLLWEWISSWYTYRCSQQHSYLLKIKDKANEEIVGYAPFFLKERKLAALKFRELAFAGSDSICSEYLDVIIKKGVEVEVINAIFDYLMKHHDDWDCIKLTDLLPDSITYITGKELIRKYNLNLYLGISRICIYKPLPSSWDKFIKSLRKKRRDEFKYYENKLTKMFKNIEYGKVSNDKKEVYYYMNKLMDLHQTRWKSKDIYGIFSSNSMKNFHFQVASRMSVISCLDLYYLKLENKIVSMLYGFNYNKKIYYYNSGFDIAYKDYAVGMLLIKNIFENCISHGIIEFDFLRGQSPYKFKFMPDKRNTYYLELHQKKLKNYLFIVMCSAKNICNKYIPMFIPKGIRKHISIMINKRKSKIIQNG
ncbi:GNAT family N-acetyltransferase [Planctomycetota bacterium]